MVKDLILLSLPDWVDAQPTMYFPLALTGLAAVVSRAGYSVEILDCRAGLKDLPEAKFYGFSCATPQINIAKQLVKKVRGQTIIGGAHASLLPNDCVKHFDYVVRGEGEEVILDILAGKAKKGIIQAPRIRDLNSLPYPAWDMVEQPFSDVLFPGERYGKGELAATIIGSRGCPYACDFCLPTDTKVLTADLRWQNIQDISVGDKVVGVEQENGRYHYMPSDVLNKFSRDAEVWAIETTNGTVFCTKEHPWLMGKHFKSIADIEAHIKHNARFDSTRAVLRKMSTPCPNLPEGQDYMIGYISGAIAGDGCINERTHIRDYGKGEYTYRRMQLVGDFEMMDTVLKYAGKLGLPFHERKFNGGEIYPNCTRAIVCDKSEISEGVFQIIEHPQETLEYIRGFLSGIYDAEGSYSQTVMRIANNDLILKQRIARYLSFFGFVAVIEKKAVRIIGGFSEQIRFLALVKPKVIHKTTDWVGRQVHNSSKILRVCKVGLMKVYNLKTSAGTFIADGFITHNCGNINRTPVIFRSVANITGELRELVNRGVRHFRFEDDCFTIHPQFEKLCGELQKLDIKYKCHTRSDLLTLEKAHLMKESGCEESGLGIESADDKVLKLVNKRETTSQHLAAVKILKDAGIRAKAYWVTGLPGETDETIELNKAFVRESQIDKWTVSTFTPYPGCAIFHRPGQFNIEITNYDWSKWWNFCSAYNHLLIGQTPAQMWGRYLSFYNFLKDEEWKK